MKQVSSKVVRHAACALVAWTATCMLPASNAGAEGRTANPAGGGGTVVLEPVPASRGKRKQRTVFVCEADGAPVYSDLPCGQVVMTRELDVVEPGPGKAASTLQAEPKAATRPLVQRANLETEPPPRSDRCDKLREQLDALDDHMRSGYGAREAAGLWNRWRDLKAKLHASRC